MQMDPDHIHKNGPWEVNVVAKHFTYRCCRCGEILQRLSYLQAEQSNIKPIKRWLAESGGRV